jgi:quercetin dioxygenase-like cupin family protein
MSEQHIPIAFVGARVDKPWGHEIIWARTERYVGKLLHINAGHALSLQYHRVKDETISLLLGTLRLQLGNGDELVDRILEPGQSVHLTPGTRHRMIAVTDCDVLEASTPELDDVVRLEDRYGRVK